MKILCVFLSKALLFVFMAGFLQGCSDLMPVDDISIILAMGIDELDNRQILVSVQIVNPKSASPSEGQGGGKQSFTVYSASGKTIEQTLEKINERLPRQIFLAHNSVVIFGHTYAKHGINRAFEYLERNRDIRRNELLVVTNGRAVDVLRAPSQGNIINAFAIQSLVQHGAETSVTVNSTQQTVMKQYLSPSHSPLLARVNVGPNGHLQEDGLGLFDGGRLVDCLSTEDAYALLLFIGNTRQHPIALPGDVQKVGNRLTMRILTSQTNVKPVVRGKEIGIKVQVWGQTEIEQMRLGSKATPDFYRLSESETQHELKKKMIHALYEIQQHHVDAAQFGNAFFRADPPLWRRVAHRWNETLPHLFVDVDVKVHVYRSGLIGDSPDEEYTREGYSPRGGRDVTS